MVKKNGREERDKDGDKGSKGEGKKSYEERYILCTKRGRKEDYREKKKVGRA